MAQDGIAPSGQTIVKSTALGPVANTDTKLLIDGLFQKGRVLAQDGVMAILRWEGWKVKSPSGDFGLFSDDAAIEQMQRPVGVLGVAGVMSHHANRSTLAVKLADEMHHCFAIGGI